MTDTHKKKHDEELEVVETEDGESFDTRDAAAALKKAKTELKECRAKAEEYLAGWQRSKADFINRRKEEERERSAMANYANERMAREVLNIVDGLEMALSAMGGDKHAKGIDAIYRQLTQILRGYGVVPLECIGA